MTDAVLVGLIAAVPGTIAAIASWRNGHKADKLAISVDGRLSQLLESTRTENQATGHAAGVEAERVREARPLP